jgi:phage-related protein
MNSPEWSVKFYEKANGRCPVHDFLDDLRPHDRRLMINALEQLATHGLALKHPQVHVLRDGIRELRVATTNKRQRGVLYSLCERNTFVLLLAYTKKAKRVPDSIIDKALEYKRDHEVRLGRGR